MRFMTEFALSLQNRFMNGTQLVFLRKVRVAFCTKLSFVIFQKEHLIRSMGRMAYTAIALLYGRMNDRS
jgi:hypothetical protein